MTTRGPGRELHPVGAALSAALDGKFPAEDGRVEVVPPWRDGVEAVVSFTAHAMVATTLPAVRVVETGIDAYAQAFAPSVLTALAGQGGWLDCVDVVLVAAGTGHTWLPERPDLGGHPRVRHARSVRDHVHVHGDERGLVTVGRGLGGLPEISFETADPGVEGAGRSLLTEALGLVPEGEPVVVAVAAGNARSMRSALAVGFVPVGAAQLVRPGRPVQPAPRR
jgi:hypothetical protein